MKNSKLKISLIIPAFSFAFFIFACSNRPAYVLSERKMEKVMYDIYLAEAEINVNPAIFSSDSTRKQKLLKSVFEKHRITEADLDTSLAWYSGRLEKYFKINEKLSKRFSETSEKLQHQEELLQKLNASGDNNGMVLPVDKERFLLRPADLSQHAYTFRPDTILSSYGGTYELQFNVMGIPASLYPVVSLCIQCTDTTFVKRDTINRNGLFLSSVDILQTKQARELYGSIYFPEVYPGMSVFIQEFSLSHFSFSRKERNLEIQSLPDKKNPLFAQPTE